MKPPQRAQRITQGSFDMSLGKADRGPWIGVRATRGRPTVTITTPAADDPQSNVELTVPKEWVGPLADIIYDLSDWQLREWLPEDER